MEIGFAPGEFLSCDLSEVDHAFDVSSHDGEIASSQGSPISPMHTLTEGSEELQIGSNNSTGECSSDEQNSDSIARRRDYVNRCGELWNHWEYKTGKGKMSLMKCRYCTNEQLKNAPKCRRHLIKCTGTPEDVRRFFERKERESNHISAVKKEIRVRGLKVSRADASAHLLANSLTTHKASTPQPARAQADGASQLNTSAPASILKSDFAEHDNNSGVRVARRKRKSNTATPQPPIQTPVRLSALDRTPIGPWRNILAPYHAQSTVPPLPQDEVPNALVANKLNKPLHSTTSMTLSNDFNMSNNQDVQSAAAAVASVLSGGSNSLLSDPSFLSLYLKSLGMRNNTEPLPCNDLTKSSAANLAAVLNGSTTNSLRRKHPSTNHSRENSLLLNQTLNLSTKSNGKENKQKKVQNSVNNPMGMNVINGVNGNTVVIHVDDGPRLESNSVFYPNVTTISPPPPLEPAKAKRVKMEPKHEIESVLSRQFEISSKAKGRNANAEPSQNDLNNLLASAFLSGGVDFSFIKNPFLQEFVKKLSHVQDKKYRFPTLDDLLTINLKNLSNKFNDFTSQLFNEADSVVASFDNVKHQIVINPEKMNVHLYIQTSEKENFLFYKQFDLTGNSEDLDRQVNSTVIDIQPPRIDAVILPYDNAQLSDHIRSYFTSKHQHVVPLTNAYQLVDHMLADICRVEPINNLLHQCISMFQVSVRFFKESDKNRAIWRKIVDSRHFQMYKHLMYNNDSSYLKNSQFWLSMHMMLHWFLVAKTDLAYSLSKSNDFSIELNEVFKKVNIDDRDICKFFDKIEILFDFITPFIAVVNNIQFESHVISDIIKHFYDMKASFDGNEIMGNMDTICESAASQQELDGVLTRYIQEDNFSDFYFLAYYLDPRYKKDKQVEENDDLIGRVHNALTLYSNALGCQGDTDDDSTQMTKSLTDVVSDFRNDLKMFCSSGSSSSQPPSKYWKEMSRYQIPGVTQLAFCASRLLSISSKALLLTAQEYLLNPESPDELKLIKDDKQEILKRIDSNVSEQLPAIKNYLCRENDVVSFKKDSIDQTVSNVIRTLETFNDILIRHKSK